MRMVLVVVVEPSGDLVKRLGGVGHGADAEVVALQSLHEGLAHAVALWARHRREAGNEIELRGEDAGLAGGVDRAVVREPFHRMRRPDAAEADLHGFEHHVADVGGADPAPVAARQAMTSRSWASRTKAPRTTSPFQQVNSKPSEHQ